LIPSPDDSPNCSTPSRSAHWTPQDQYLGVRRRLAGGEQFLGRVDHGQQVTDPGQRQYALNLVGAAHQGKATTGLLRALMGAQQDPQTGRIHELDLAQIEDHELGTGRPDAIEPLLELGAGPEIELAGGGQNPRRPFVPLLYAEFAVHSWFATPHCPPTERVKSYHPIAR